MTAKKVEEENTRQEILRRRRWNTCKHSAISRHNRCRSKNKCYARWKNNGDTSKNNIGCHRPQTVELQERKLESLAEAVELQMHGNMGRFAQSESSNYERKSTKAPAKTVVAGTMMPVPPVYRGSSEKEKGRLWTATRFP
ncbi:unnamed protein product [Peronospora belbahrii]|uniref:Dof-type domain-containing protein n=1 Tax=Peronospora belbahrii TaxID=622444 RepID=A0AAU9L4N0_9STRA|nr:unnamed protein product [Peronospora belbahrii]CAH0517099.1 unnamed protein product [Peronospora belbahrii]